MDRFDALSVALVGIGALPIPAAGANADHVAASDTATEPNSSLVRSGALRPADIRALLAAGAVGDLLVHPFDAAGRFVAPDLGERAMAITVDQLRRVPRVVAVAAGESKAAAIAGALRTGVIRILVTDAAAATRLLDESVA